MGPQQRLNNSRPRAWGGTSRPCWGHRGWAARRQPNGVEVLWNPVKRRVKTRESEAPAEPPNAGLRC